MRRTRDFTPRAFVVGILCSFFIAAGSPYGNMMINYYGMSADFITAGALFLFFILVGLANAVLRLLNRSFGLSPAELMLVYVMMIVASAIPSWGLVEAFLTIITGVSYYATPENGWIELIHPHISDWLIPQEKEAIYGFYEGLPQGTPLPWRAWTRPLLYWCSFFIVLYFVMMCMMVIIRKQWVEKERLIYPLAALPLEMVKADGSGSILPPFFKNKLMWLGFAIPFVFASWNAFHEYFYFIPPIKSVWYARIFRQTMTLKFMLSFPILGFGYLLNLDVAFSLWFFHLLYRIQEGICRTIGFSMGHPDPLGGEFPIASYEGMGALIVLVLLVLWTARSHLEDVFGKAFGRDSQVDDAEEVLSYRTAVFGMIGGLFFLAFWLRASGMPFSILPLFLFLAFVIFLGLTRIIAEGGVGFCRSPHIPQPFITGSIGNTALGPAGLTALAFSFVWVSDIRTIVMTSTANGLKLADRIGMNKRRLFWAVMVAVVVGLAGSIWMILTLSYEYGGINFNVWFFRECHSVPWNFLDRNLRNPESVNWGAWLFTGIGAGLMALLMVMRHRLLWWPIHYIGLPISGTYMARNIWFSVFLAWLLKSVILKYGGPKWYRALRPFFLGLVLGQIVCAGMWLIIDSFTGMSGNNVTVGVG